MFRYLKSAFGKSAMYKSHIPKGAKSSHYLYSTGQPVWMNRNYRQFADEAYVKNVVAYRSINMIAHGAANIPIKLWKHTRQDKTPVAKHPVLDLLDKPNPLNSGKELFEAIYTYRQIHGNAYLLSAGSEEKSPEELYPLRPDRVSVLSGKNFLPSGYRYKVNSKYTDFPVNPVTGKSQILHIKNFHPLSDWYGLSSIEAAAYSIDQHNQAGSWNQALLQNGARPSGAIMVKDEDGRGMSLDEEQFANIRNMIDEAYVGSRNVGRPMVLEGGLEWKEMSLSPKDMDFIESKHSSARDIALAFGMPPQLLGIPGDSTYSNLKEARVALWEQTIIPLLENTMDHLNRWLLPMFEDGLELSYDRDNISALGHKRDAVWERIQKAEFMTVNEKRAAVGLSPIKDGDVLQIFHKKNPA